MKHHDIEHADARFQYRCPALPCRSPARQEGLTENQCTTRRSVFFPSSKFIHIIHLLRTSFTFFTTDPSLSLASPPAPVLQTAFDSAEGLRIRRLHPRRVDARQLLPHPHHGQRHEGVLRILLVSQRLKKVTARAPPRRCAAIGF